MGAEPLRSPRASPDPRQGPRLALLSNIPAPYRISFLNVLHDVLQESGGSLCALFCAEREPNRDWEVPLDEQRYEWKIMPGFQVTALGAYLHWNPSVVREVRSWSPTWLLVAGAWNTPTMIRAVLSHGLRMPRLFWSEGHTDAVRFARGPVPWLRRSILGRFDGFAVPNRLSADFLRAELRSEVPLLPLANTVAEDFYREATSAPRDALRDRFGIEADECSIVSVAQLCDRKGVLELARGYAALPAALRERVSLTLIGDGELRPSLESMARRLDAGAIRLTGPASAREVRDRLAAADVFVLASRSDPNPLSVIEAAFAGLPLLVSGKAGNARDVVESGANGWVLEDLAPESIARELERVASLSREERARMGRRSLEIAEREFRRDHVARQFVTRLMQAFPPPRA